MVTTPVPLAVTVLTTLLLIVTEQVAVLGLPPLNDNV